MIFWYSFYVKAPFMQGIDGQKAFCRQMTFIAARPNANAPYMIKLRENLRTNPSCGSGATAMGALTSNASRRRARRRHLPPVYGHATRWQN